ALDNVDVALAAAAWSHRTGDLFYESRVVRAGEPVPKALTDRADARPKATWKVRSETTQQLWERIDQHRELRLEIMGRDLDRSERLMDVLWGEAVFLEFIAKNREDYERFVAIFSTTGSPAPGAEDLVNAEAIKREMR